MGETVNISKIAENAFREIFRLFGWQQTGTGNENWKCLGNHKLVSPSTGTHPTDAVYRYVEPYQSGGQAVFVNVDFKSYAHSTLKSTNLFSALQSLANTIDCANRSPEYRSKYCGDEDGEIVGLLFVYNHDNVYDPSLFREKLRKGVSDRFDLAKERRLAVFGPDDIAYLLSIAADIKTLRGEDEFANFTFKFFLPNLIEYPMRADTSLSIELLLSRWQIVKFSGVRGRNPHSEIHMYYRAEGTIAQFDYILDYLFRFQLLEDNQEVYLRLPHPGRDAAANLEYAKIAFVARYCGLREIEETLRKVKYRSVIATRFQFSIDEIGMPNA